MASMGDMPDVTWNIMPLRSRHGLSGKNSLFTLEKCLIRLFWGVISTLFSSISDTYYGPTPLPARCFGSLPSDHFVAGYAKLVRSSIWTAVLNPMLMLEPIEHNPTELLAIDFSHSQ